ncbi:hypothetical protein, partial [Klebsiella pneumoniae]|uniref:hypothetical protein n=1 Tax=Klebsiella pneumoniae TaxID=573 RepID=UPI0040553C89
TNSVFFQFDIHWGKSAKKSEKLTPTVEIRKKNSDMDFYPVIKEKRKRILFGSAVDKTNELSGFNCGYLQ